MTREVRTECKRPAKPGHGLTGRYIAALTLTDLHWGEVTVQLQHDQHEKFHVRSMRPQHLVPAVSAYRPVKLSLSF